MPPTLVTQSTSSRASPLPSPSGAMSERTPVDVSAWTTAMTRGDGWAASSRSGSTGWPHGASTATTSAPQRAATSHMRAPNTPLTPMTTGSPGRTRLTNAASMPAEPVPEIGRVMGLAVRKTAAQPVAGLVEDGDELRIEVPEHRARQGLDGLGVRVAGPRSHQDAVGQRHADS